MTCVRCAGKISSPWQGEVGAKRREGVGPRTRRLSGKVALARRLRKQMTPPEALLWQGLRKRQLEGLRFRRQHPIGPYVLDFYCPRLALAIEVDGSQHAFSLGRQRDARRDNFLRRKGITVLRYWNSDIMGNLKGVLDDIRHKALFLLGRPTPSLSLPLSGGGNECGGARAHVGEVDR